MQFEIVKILHDISSMSILVPFLVGTFLYARLSKDSRLIFFVVFFGAVSQLMQFYFPKETATLNILYNLYTPIEFGLILFLFLGKWKTIIAKRIFYVSIAFYFFVSLFFLFKSGIFDDFLSTWAWVSNLTYVIWILAFLFEQYQEKSILVFRPSAPFFWFIIGILFYSACTMLTFSFWSFMEAKNSEIGNVLKIIHHIFNTNMYIFFSIGFLKDGIKKINDNKILD